MSAVPNHTQPEFSTALLPAPDQPVTARQSERHSLSPTTRSCFPWRRGHFGLADLWRHGPTANRASRFYSRSAAAQRYVA